MEVSLAYAAKKPIVSDEEYDQLKSELRDQNSKVTQQARAKAEDQAAHSVCQSTNSACPRSRLSNMQGRTAFCKLWSLSVLHLNALFEAAGLRLSLCSGATM